MRYKDEQCPQCGNFVRGQYKRSDNTKRVAKGGKSLAVFAANMLHPGLGTMANVLIGDKVENAISGVVDELDSDDEYLFECPKCGHRWESSGRPPIPEEIIIQVRDAYVEETKKKRPYISTFVYASLTIYAFVYFYIGCTNESPWVGIQITFGLFGGIAFLIPTIFKWRKWVSLNKEIANSTIQSPAEFRNSHRELFRHYGQYR